MCFHIWGTLRGLIPLPSEYAIAIFMLRSKTVYYPEILHSSSAIIPNVIAEINKLRIMKYTILNKGL